MKKTYKVLTAFKWRGHWRDPGEQLSLLDCEAEALKRAGKVELVKTSTTRKKEG